MEALLKPSIINFSRLDLFAGNTCNFPCSERAGGHGQFWWDKIFEVSITKLTGDI